MNQPANDGQSRTKHVVFVVTTGRGFEVQRDRGKPVQICKRRKAISNHGCPKLPESLAQRYAEPLWTSPSIALKRCRRKRAIAYWRVRHNDKTPARENVGRSVANVERPKLSRCPYGRPGRLQR